MLVFKFSTTLCLLILSITSSIPSAQAFHWAGNVMYDLEYQGFAFDDEASSWSSSLGLVTSGVLTSQCGSNRVLGGYNIMAGSSLNFGTWYKTYSSLPTHNTIYFKMRLYMVDSWSSSTDHFHLFFDGSNSQLWDIGSNYANYATANQWGNPSYYDLDPMMISFTIPHTANTLKVEVSGHFSAYSTVKSVAVRDLTMTFATESSVPSKSFCGVAGYSLSSSPCSCGSGTTMSPANSGICIGCDSSCLTCSGTGSSKCTSCVTGQFLLHGACYSCPSTCLTCNAATIGSLCTSCVAGEYVSNGDCYGCDSSCSTCDGAGRTACTSCLSPLVLVSGTCCNPSCATCSGTGSSNCASCAVGKYLSGGVCSSCDSSCLTCSGAGRTACVSCQSPLVLIGGSCCDPSCATCSGISSTNCASCANGKYLTSGGACSSCDSSCLTCNGAGRTACASCQSALVLASGACCHSSCDTCSGTGASNCLSCANGKYLTSGGSCSSCDSSCLTCNGAGRAACASCQPPYILASGSCCHSSCDTCSGTGASNCLSCANGKYLTSGGACSSCDLSCLTCSGAGRIACASCQSPLALIGGSCCDPSCATCNGISSTNCASCANGKYLTIGGACSSCDSSCLTCSGPGRTECTSCPSPLVFVSGTCCDPSCATCSAISSSSCTSCANGKYLTSSGTCSSCDSSCLTCNGAGRIACASCQSPLALIGGSCCDPSCATCSGISSTNCASCANGEYLTSGGACSSCDSSCLTCNGGTRTACTSCQSSLVLVGASCCGPSCATCTGTGSLNCASCVNGKYLTSGGACSSCDSSCLTCNSAGPTGCLTCASNKYLSGTSCFDSCDSPLVKSGANNCHTPCPGQSAYIEGGCGSCPLPRIKIQMNGYDVCGAPCPDSSMYYYWNASCLSTCPYPLDKTVDVTGTKFCTNPCGTSGDFLFSNHTCLSTCPSPLSAIEDPGVQYCRTPCNSASFLYENRTCIGNCLLPFVKRFEPFAQFCDRPCDPGIFWFRNTSCLANCPAPYVQTTYSGVLQCLPPCKDSEYFYEFEKICNPKCESPFSTKSFEVIKICYNAIPISLAETTNVQNAAAGMQSQGDMASGGMKAAGAMNSGSPSSALLAGLSSMLQYIRYMRINYPPKVQMLFLVSAGSPISLGFDFDIPESVAKKLDDNKLADVFEKYDVNSNFVNNLWDFLMTLLIVMIVIGVLSVIKFLVPEKKLPRISLILSKILGAIRWNVPIMIVCSSSGDIFFYASLQIQSSSLNSFAAIICLIVSVFMMIVVLAILMIGLKILKNWKKEAKNPNWSDKWKGYEILYEEYEEKSIWSLSYMILFIIRGIIFNLTLANLFNFPLVQCIIINISNVVMFSYLIYLRPLKNLLNLVQLFVNEGLVNIIGVSIIILAIMDKAGINGQSTRVSVGDAIYFVIKVFNTFGLVFMGLGLLVFLMFAFKTWRRMKAQKISSPMKILKAMVLGEAVGETQPNPFETNEVSKRAKIRKPQRKRSVQTTSQMQVIYIDETEMSRVQMVNDISSADLSINEDFSPKRNNALRQTAEYQEEVSSDIHIADLDNNNIQPSYELTRGQDNSPSFRAFSIKKSQIMNITNEVEQTRAVEEKTSPDMRGHPENRNRKILKIGIKSREPQMHNQEQITMEAKKKEKVLDDNVQTEMEVTKIVENPQIKNKGLGGFLKNLGGRIKGQKKSKEPSPNQKVSTKETMKKQEKVIEKKVEIGASDLQVTEFHHDDNMKNKSGGFIQNWGKFKGHLRLRRASQEQVMEVNKEKVEIAVSEIGITGSIQSMEKDKSAEFIQDWGRFKGRMKSKESSNISLHQGEKSQVKETSKKEERIENVEISEIKENLHNDESFIQDWGRMKSNRTVNESISQREKPQFKKEEATEERIEPEANDHEIAENSQNGSVIQDWENLQDRMSRLKASMNENESSLLFKEIKELELS